MQKRIPVLAILAALIFSTACSLSATLPAQSALNAPTVEPLASPTRGVVVIDARTPSANVQSVQNVQPTQIVQAQPQSASAQSVSAQSGGGSYTNTNTTYSIPTYCTPRYDWGYTYVVQRGDTLSNIAYRANVSLQTLAQGNCISNPNYIYAGQVLRVPCQVSTNPPPYYPPPYYPPPSGGVQYIGQVLPSPFVTVENGHYQLQSGTVVNLSWAINASGLTKVDFYYTPTISGSSYLIGSDTYFGDGVSIAWAVPAGVDGLLSADGNNGNRLVKQTAYRTLIYTSNPQPPPPTTPPTPLPPVIVGSALSFSPLGEINNNTVMLPPDQLINIIWNGSFPTAVDRVEFQLVSPIDGSAQSLGVDLNPGDGVSILWNAVAETQGTLYGIAYFTGGYAPQYSDSYYVIARNPY